MFIAFVIILLFILLGVLVGAYSVFSPFTQNIGDVIDFNSAYYGAIAGIERANLVLKYKSPGFEGSGGFFGTQYFGPVSDKVPQAFGNLKRGGNGFTWNIRSRTFSIPSSGDGNVDYLLANTDSSNFNQLPYFTSEKIFLYVDNTNTNNPTNAKKVYTGGSTFDSFTGGNFSGQFRLPGKVVTAFSGSLLCADPNVSACDSDGDDMFDEITLNWALKGNYNGVPFAILPNASVFYYSGMKIDENKDTMIRESVINTDSGSMYFGKDVTQGYFDFNPVLKYNQNNLTKHNVISPDPGVMNNKPFSTLLTNTDSNPITTGLEFSFGLVNLLHSTNNNIYPFLEYQLKFGSQIANRFYTIEGNSLVGNYNVKIIMKKSTNNDAQIGDFTIIF